MKLGRDTMIAMDELKRLLFDDPDIPITQGYLVGVAYNRVKNKKIKWKDISKDDIPNVTNNTTSEIQGVQTTLNLENDTLKGIKELQKSFIYIFNAKRVHTSFVVKLVLFAAVLDCNGLLDEYIEKEA